MARKRLSPHFGARNARRVALILMEHPLTEAEAQELAELREWTQAELDRVYPISFWAIERIDARLKALHEECPD